MIWLLVYLSSFTQINIENIELKKQPNPAIAKWLRYPKEHRNFDYDVIDYLVDYKWNSTNVNIIQLINYAYSKWHDLDFVETLNMENWNRDETLQSRQHQNGVREQSFGICQINKKFHKKFISSEEFNNPFYQIDYCRELRLNGKKRGIMPFNAYWSRKLRSNDLVLINK